MRKEKNIVVSIETKLEALKQLDIGREKDVCFKNRPVTVMQKVYLKEEKV